MTRPFDVRRFVVLGALAASSVSCGDLVRQGRSPMYLVIDSLQASSGEEGALRSILLSDVLTNDLIFNDFGQVVLRLSPKDVMNPVAPSTNNEVTITRYRVTFRRADGRNTPGSDVPFPFDGAVTGTVRIGAALPIGFELVRHAAKLESPLVQLGSNQTIITTIADVTFYGRDQVGNDISATGSIQVNFGDFSDPD